MLRNVRRVWPAVAALFIVFVSLSPAFAQGGSQPSEQALAEIAGLLAEKAARTPAQQKIDSQLLYAAQQRRTGRASSAAPQMRMDGVGDADGQVDVEVRGTVNDVLRDAIIAAGGKVVREYPRSHTIEAIMPLLRLEALAQAPAVRFIRPLSPVQRPQPLLPPAGSDTGTTENAVGATSASTPPTSLLTPRLAQFRDTLQRAIEAHGRAAGTTPAVSLAGAVNSQGDLTHGAKRARDDFGIDGTGLRIGVLSDSFNNLGAAAADVASGDLPGPGNPNGRTTPVRLAGSGDMPGGGSDEGRAMLQIVHDLAPGAELYYATAFNSAADFANNIRALRGIATSAPPNGNVTPGCDIIIDDVFYFIESGLHEGQPASVVSSDNIAEITQAVNDVVASGALYFSSAGNSGGVTQGTAGAWEGDFASGGSLTIPGAAGPADVLDWDPGAGIAQVNNITAASIPVVHWSDPIGGSANDYDFFVLNSTLTAVVQSSTNVQGGTQDPVEAIFSQIAGGNRLVITRNTGAAARFLSVTTNRGRLQFATPGQVRGHSIAPGAYAVAATPAAASFGAPTPNGPFPGPFVASNQVEPFNSDGPRRVFFDVNNQPITPGNFLAGTNGGALRAKPDLTAADGVATTLPGNSGLNPFYGTSAAAPHAGAIAALILDAAPTSTPAQVRQLFENTALDIMAPGVDRDSGVGIIQAYQAISSFNLPGLASLELGTVTLQRTDAAGLVEAGATALVTIPIVNSGIAPATAISAVLASTTPCVTVTAASSLYPDIQAAASASNGTPFEIRLSPLCPCPQLIKLSLTVTYAGGQTSTRVLPITFDPNPVLVITETLDTTAPAANAAYVGATATQTGRINRFTPGSSCASPKPYPGLAATTGARRYDSYTFGSSPIDRCVGFALSDLTGTVAKLFPVVYSPSFNPSILASGYRGDTGGSPPGGGPPARAEVLIPAGETPVIVVHEVNVGGAPNNNYRLEVSGLNSCQLPFASVLPQGTSTSGEASDGDGDGFVEPCESAAINVTVRNRGVVTATNVQAVLASDTPGVSVTTANAAFPDMVAGGSATSSTPFVILAGPSVPCGTVVNLTLTLSFNGGASGGSPVSLPVSMRVGANPQVVFSSETGGSLPAGELIAGSQDDDAAVPVAAPFALAVYDTVVPAGSNVFVSTNGNVQLAPGGVGVNSTFNNVALPATAFGAFPVLMPYWNDLDLRTSVATQPSGIYSSVSGTAPQRTWTLVWRGETFDGDFPIEFAVQFAENSKVVRYRYNNSAGATGESATIGIQSGQSLFTQRSLNTAGAVGVGTVLTGTSARCDACRAFANGFEGAAP